MTGRLQTLDLIVLLAYLAAVVAFGCWFVRRSRTTDAFMAAGRSLPGWAVGLSIFGTYLSSNTFIGYPGAAYGGNWNRFVFSLALPIAALIAVKVFVPFYRRTGEISAYHHLERRFGPWARTYAVVFYLLMQVSRMGAILFGVSIALQALTGWPISAIIIVTGALITLYTLLGGIEAVIWTDVVQSIVLLAGAVLITLMLLFGMPEGPGQAIEIAREHGKFSLGSFELSFAASTFWVVLLYGLFENLKNFGIDQSFVQRYHAAKSDAAAGRSVWLAALLYVPVSLMFLFIGSLLFSYYETQPQMLGEVKRTVAMEKLTADDMPVTDDAVAAKAATLEAKDIGDKVLPHYMAQKLPAGVAGLLIAAILAAAMSSIDTSLNSSATVILSDIVKRYVKPDISERGAMAVLRGATVGWGAVGVGVALAMIGVASVLDAWWTLAGVFSGGMLGLFLLGLIARRAGNVAAAIGVAVGVLVIFWATLSQTGMWPQELAFMKNSMHALMTIVIGTLTIFLVGWLVGILAPRPGSSPADQGNVRT